MILDVNKFFFSFDAHTVLNWFGLRKSHVRGVAQLTGSSI